MNSERLEYLNGISNGCMRSDVLDGKVLQRMELVRIVTDRHSSRNKRSIFLLSLICRLKFYASHVIHSYCSIETALIIDRVEPSAFSASVSIVAFQRLILQFFI